MVEIIIREEGEPSQHIQINGEKCQASFNSWGHLAVRIIESPTKDTLVVFTKEASAEIINFVQQKLAGPRFVDMQPPF
ncbi:MAG: hypothetical protein ABSC17_09770 [Thermacetogeniaceae bacterium]